jgi:serine/threonine-protein phosphatase PGAM5
MQKITPYLSQARHPGAEGRPLVTRAAICLGFSMMLLVAGEPARAADPPRSGPGIHYLLLIRHGTYDRDTTVSDVLANGLNALGHEQAHLVGARLAALPVQPASLVTSNYRRARETAEDIGQEMKRAATIDTLLHECTPSSDRPDDLRGHRTDEIAACDSNLARAWARYMVPTPDADRHDILVCHGNVIRWFVSHAVANDPRRWPWLEIGNASITILAVRPDGTIRLVCFSDVGHLPLAKQTWSGKGAGWGAAAR